MVVGFVSSEDLIDLTSLIPKIGGRSDLVSQLISSFLLTDKMEIVEPNEICG